ncbi:hypothetical protein [Mesorhizobium sp. M0578]|uniref:hypothetical protein n=1 Tax=unclassified Mesorhizobium TaxID=325217 RepID=UPI0033383E46
MTGKIPYYVVKKGRGYFQPTPELQAKGFRSVACGVDGVQARELASRLASEARTATRRSPLRDPIRRLLIKSLKNARERAQKRGIDCALTLDDVISLAEANNWRCAVSGVPFAMIQIDGGIVRQPFAPSLDRIVNKGGYVKGNVRIVLTAVNYALNEWGEEVLRMVAIGICQRPKKEQTVGTSSNSPLLDPQTATA